MKKSKLFRSYYENNKIQHKENLFIFRIEAQDDKHSKSLGKRKDNKVVFLCRRTMEENVIFITLDDLNIEIG